MTRFRATEVAALLGVSDDTVRRWIDAGRLPAVRDHAGRWSVAGRDLAEFATQSADRLEIEGAPPTSAQNRMPGLVTRVEHDGLLARVELVAGPFRLVSVMPREAAEALGLAPGVLTVAAVTATDLLLEAPARRH